MKNIKTAILRLFKPNATDENWDYFGQKCPYFGVITSQQYKPENFDGKARQEFFQTGRQYVTWLMDFIHQNINPDFHPKNSVDFGCGVGRLLIPIARESISAVGIEVSPSMMKEAKVNCQLMGVHNVQFVKTADELASSRDRFDFVNSFIVFQHIPPKRGYEIFQQLLALLQDGGIGAVHFTYCDPGRRRDRYMQPIFRIIPLLFAFQNMLTGKPLFEPRMEMAEYSLNRLFRILHENGCHLNHTAFTNHGVMGVVIVFQKAQIPRSYQWFVG
jgi:2-polyprenyl-3-methyl-5-hydroxy-6-metoxy-1,4-benzoquinol methylase